MFKQSSWKYYDGNWVAVDGKLFHELFARVFIMCFSHKKKRLSTSLNEKCNYSTYSARTERLANEWPTVCVSLVSYYLRVYLGVVRHFAPNCVLFSYVHVYMTNRTDMVPTLLKTNTTRVEAGSNTSTVTLRVVRGDEMGLKKGRAIAKAVSRWLPTAAVRGSRPGLSCGILWWTKWRWGRFSPSTSVAPANFHSTNCSKNHPHLSSGFVQ
jgi:hypothetical protein